MATSSEKVTENVTFDLAIAKSVESNDVVGILLDGALWKSEKCGNWMFRVGRQGHWNERINLEMWQ